MDFALPHRLKESITSQSNIRLLDYNEECKRDITPGIREDSKLDQMLIKAANKAALDLFGCTSKHSSDGNGEDGTVLSDNHHWMANSKHYKEHLLSSNNNSSNNNNSSKGENGNDDDTTTKIQPGALCVIFESFDSLNFVYATPGDVFTNRNGQFCHDDFLGKPFGCQIRSRIHGGYGFVYILKPTPELWARSLPHRTQIVHELDASMICFMGLQLKPNMVVCESGTGSGAMSHAILRTIAPHGKLHTYEFNEHRAIRAREEFRKNKVDHLVRVHYKDVCGKVYTNTNNNNNNSGSTGNNDDNNETYEYSGEKEQQQQQQQQPLGGFDLGPAVADAIFLDLPEPWLAVPHAAYVIKPASRLCSYSPCVEQSQRTIVALKKAGFHSIKTMEFRLREHYVDSVELMPPPSIKLPKLTEPPGPSPGELNYHNINNNGTATATNTNNTDTHYQQEKGGGVGEETEKVDLETATKPAAASTSSPSHCDDDEEVDEEKTIKDENTMETEPMTAQKTNNNEHPSSKSGGGGEGGRKRKMVCARPFGMMRGHTAFLTFATAGNRKREDPNKKKT